MLQEVEERVFIYKEIETKTRKTIYNVTLCIGIRLPGNLHLLTAVTEVLR